MKKYLVVGIVVTVLVFAAGLMMGKISQNVSNQAVRPTPTIIDDWSNELQLNNPKPGDNVKSPLEVSGKIKRSWTFEAIMSVWLIDSRRQVVGGGPVYTTAENETDEWVNFSTTINFETNDKGGYLQFKNDNPSGLPENAKQIEIPISFQ